MAEERGQILEEEPEEKRDPEREARRRLALAQIRQYPDPALRLSAAEIDAFDVDLRRLAERMYVLMTDASGIGLAATQVGSSGACSSAGSARTRTRTPSPKRS